MFSGDGTCMNDSILLDFDKNILKLLKVKPDVDFPIKRNAHVFVSISSSSYLVFGGTTGEKSLNDIYIGIRYFNHFFSSSA